MAVRAQGRLRPKRSRLLNPVVWISLGQVTWIVVLVGWIVYVIDRNDQLSELAAAVRAGGASTEWSSLVWGVVLLVVLFVTMVVVSVALTRYWSENKAMHSFVSTVSHELRTPLASIRLYLETLQAHADLGADERDEFVTTMMADVERLSASIEAILAASRIERRGVRLDLVPIELADYLRRYGAGRERPIELRRRQLQLEIDRPAWVLASAEALETVLNNLIENAVRYSADGDVIRLALRRERGRALVVVSDPGRGIKASDVKHLFKMFYRATSSTGVQGTGLGLYIVKGLMQAMGGEVQVRSEGTDRGTTVIVSLPEHNPTEEA